VGGLSRDGRTLRDQGIQLSFNHQKRFGGPFRAAKHRLDDGAIGELERFVSATES